MQSPTPTELYTLSLHDALPILIDQMERLIAEKTARTPAQRKIASSLLYTKSGRFDALIAQINKDPAKQIKDRKSTRLNSSHVEISYAVFCLKKKKLTNL